ncbi:class I SAM-dependent methyltransferase [Microbispora sp. RL4-1S]|uniref:Class I SAM-dependent methyltransferase n=2 Tax=Microbispora oryzae TaxID=2806554 RepID=A0A940WGE5_9ACTN|nr:class I SAM-dependent methyltransferase [Microbispora oryzae]
MDERLSSVAAVAKDRTGRSEDLQAVLSSLGEDRVNATLGLREIDGRVDALRRELDRLAELPDRLDAVRDDLSGQIRQTYRQLEAYVDLRSLISPRAPLPELRGWAASPDALRCLIEDVCARRPKLVVECGSGSSSVWLGYVMEHFGGGRVVCLEHDERYLELSRSLVAAHGLTHVVEIRHAPLRTWEEGGESWQWYDREALRDLDEIGLLHVDGPPAATGPQARYPAVPLLLPHCSADVRIFLDDASRDDERAVVARWRREHSLELTRREAEKGLAILTIANP